jgi:hypothetical protein
VSGIVRAESESLAKLLRDLEREADRQKHETSDPYWQGRADAFRTVLLYIPDFLYMNEQETLNLSYERACELRDAVPNDVAKDNQAVHDLDAFIVGVERLRGTFKDVNPFVAFAAAIAASEERG